MHYLDYMRQDAMLKKNGTKTHSKQNNNKGCGVRLLYGIILLLIVAFLWKPVTMFGIKCFVKYNISNIEDYGNDFIHLIEEGKQEFQYLNGTWRAYKETDSYGPWEVNCFTDRNNRKVLRFSLFGFGIVPSGWWRYMYYSPDDINDFNDPESKNVSDIYAICEKWYWYEVEW